LFFATKCGFDAPSANAGCTMTRHGSLRAGQAGHSGDHSDDLTHVLKVAAGCTASLLDSLHAARCRSAMGEVAGRRAKSRSS